METYTASQVCAAIRFNATTLRKLLNETRPLRLDADQGHRDGWRRFTRADVVRVRIVAQLMQSFNLPAHCAVNAANSLFDEVAGALKQFDEHVAAHREYPAGGGPVALFDDISQALIAPRRQMFQSPADLAAHIADDRLSPTALIVHIMHHVRYVNLQLSRVRAGEIAVPAGRTADNQ